MTGVRVGEVTEFPVGDGRDDSGRAERIDALRRRMATVTAGTRTAALPAGIADGCSTPPADRLLPVPGPLAGLLPHGGLRRGTVVSLSGATSLLLGLLASVTGAGGHAAVVGRRRLGLLAASEMGARLPRIAVIPDAGPDPVEVAAVLLDGMDLVVLDLGGAAVPPSRTRVIAARIRGRDAVLVVTGGRWDGAHVRLEAHPVGYDGLAGPGRARLHGTRLSVRVQGRAFTPRTAHVDVRAEPDAVRWSSPTPKSGDVGLGAVR